MMGHKYVYRSMNDVESKSDFCDRLEDKEINLFLTK